MIPLQNNNPISSQAITNAQPAAATAHAVNPNAVEVRNAHPMCLGCMAQTDQHYGCSVNACIQENVAQYLCRSCRNAHTEAVHSSPVSN
jgi:hypothetical protein